MSNDVFGLSEGESWLPSGDMFFWAMGLISKALQNRGSALADRFILDDTDIGYLYLTSWAMDEFKEVHSAVMEAFEEKLRELLGNADLGMGYMVYAHRLAELKALVRADPRSGDAQAVAEYGLILPNQKRWQAKGWVMDFVLESLTIRATKQSKRTDILLKYRTTELPGHEDRRLSDALDAEMLEILREIHEVYVMRGWSICVSTRFQQDLYPKIEELVRIVAARGQE